MRGYSHSITLFFKYLIASVKKIQAFMFYFFIFAGEIQHFVVKSAGSNKWNTTRGKRSTHWQLLRKMEVIATTRLRTPPLPLPLPPQPLTLDYILASTSACSYFNSLANYLPRCAAVLFHRSSQYSAKSHRSSQAINGPNFKVFSNLDCSKYF